MIQSKFNSVIVRCAAVFFWLSLFLFVLFLPRFLQNNSSDTLYIFSWSGIIDPLYIKKFEKLTGKKVKISYYENNQELLVKLKATGGKGYDLIVPSDYTVNILRKENLLHELDKNKLTFLKRLNPSFLNHYYDPENNYSVPFDWGIYGIGIDTTQFPEGLPEASWKLIFEPLHNKNLAMVNDPYEAFDIARRYLYQDKKELTLDDIESIKELLKRQHRSVMVYTDARADYLLATHNCALVVASSAYIWRGMKDYPDINFMIPKEGTILTIENFAIPKESQNKELAYEFLNFIYSLESIEHHFNYSAFSPTTIDPLTWGHLPQSKRDLLVPSKEIFKKFHFLEPSISEQDLYDVWVMVKS